MPVVMMISPEPVAFFILNSNTRYDQSTHTNIRTAHIHAQNTLACNTLKHSSTYTFAPFIRSVVLARSLARPLTYSYVHLRKSLRKVSTNIHSSILWILFHKYCDWQYLSSSSSVVDCFFFPFFTSHFHTQEHILLWQWKISNRSLSFAFDLDYLIVNAYSSSTRMYVALSPSSVLFCSGVCLCHTINEKPSYLLVEHKQMNDDYIFNSMTFALAKYNNNNNYHHVHRTTTISYDLFSFPSQAASIRSNHYGQIEVVRSLCFRHTRARARGDGGGGGGDGWMNEWMDSYREHVCAHLWKLKYV